MVNVEDNESQVLGDTSLGEVLSNHNGPSVRQQDAIVFMDASLVMAPVHLDDLTDTGETTEELRAQIRAELEKDLEERVAQRVAEIIRHTRHELRTPVTNAKMRVYLLEQALKRLLGEDVSSDTVEKLGHHLEVLRGAIDTFAEALVLDSNSLYEVRLQRISSNEIFQHLVDRYRQSGLLNDKVTLSWLFPDEDKVFTSDGDKIKSMFHILVDNALKFTARGTIHIGFTVTSEKLVIQVADTGCGIPKNRLESIFEEGVSLSQEETPAIPGSPQSTGLGLYYVKRFCEVLGGRVDVESNYGYRTMFTITLPPHSEADLHA